ncbi:hypothetical protein ASG19_03280 [Rhizobium sp. Leaf306]|jgi:hypothetical protein|uniref:Heme exporter protein D n=1 Tax=Rhizobium soli TaxID=424798 RepID=A0A7X0JIX1_9HYPH|nr:MULTISPECIES: hypothetical protein [Rhizobium]KQQ38106.1 hypothetical protein ASG19_03280 [Rhizobium sp. Leaf306]KQQ73830.1 hypothetical protein ASF70_08530 [Rhizobium sp. Leaf321]MBB6507627.1 heme exporter protein D [Rhizobium soli]MBD8664072.1 hypothetical protein [Rhizobium sp. CFBP 8752]MBP2463559.1 heme exporter protein D [Rhizobium sp. PvP014]
MKKIAITTLALVMASAFAVPSFAQTYRSESRENRQENRIYRGAVTGKLTPQELRNIARQQNRIDRAQNRAARDGVITPRERREIERRQNNASRNIYRKNNNGRTMY